LSNERLRLLERLEQQALLIQAMLPPLDVGLYQIQVAEKKVKFEHAVSEQEEREQRLSIQSDHVHPSRDMYCIGGFSYPRCHKEAPDQRGRYLSSTQR